MEIRSKVEVGGNKTESSEYKFTTTLEERPERRRLTKKEVRKDSWREEFYVKR